MDQTPYNPGDRIPRGLVLRLDALTQKLKSPRASISRAAVHGLVVSLGLDATRHFTVAELRERLGRR